MRNDHELPGVAIPPLTLFVGCITGSLLWMASFTLLREACLLADRLIGGAS